MAKEKKIKPRNGPWLKRVLIPFWVVQLVFTIALFAIYIWFVVWDPNGFVVTQVLLLILSAICIFLDIVEIILFARRKLKPLTFLIFQLVKTPIWVGFFISSMVRGIIIQHKEVNQGSYVSISYTVDVIIFAVLFFVFLGTLIYGSIILRRHRRNKRKTPLGNNITQNPYYNGPYSENGVTTANYHPLNSPYPLRTEAGDTAYEDESVGTPMPAAEHYTLDVQARKRRASSVGSGRVILVGHEGNSLVNDTAKELPAVPEIYELASARDVRRSHLGA